jgi:hypothetical protein
MPRKDSARRWALRLNRRANLPCLSPNRLNPLLRRHRTSRRPQAPNLRPPSSLRNSRSPRAPNRAGRSRAKCCRRCLDVSSRKALAERCRSFAAASLACSSPRCNCFPGLRIALNDRASARMRKQIQHRDQNPMASPSIPPLVSSEQVNGTSPSRQLPERCSGQAAGIRDIAEIYSKLAAQAFRLTSLSARRAYFRSRHSVTRTSARIAGSMQDLAARTTNEARYMQREHPIRLLSILAGTALVAGAATRIWRSPVQ